MAIPDYSKIWGANSPLAKYEFTEADYLRGWEFIGSMPPARTMFDAWMRKADEKMRWLYDNAFSENSLGGFLFWRLPDTAYFVGEKRALQDGPLDVYIECTIAGRTSKEQMKKLPQGAEIGKTFVDGTATWLVRQFVTSAALDGHRKKTPLDHPDGSVLKRHLGFEVYDKGEADSLVNTKVSKNGDTMTGTLTFANNIGACLRGTMADNDLWRIYAAAGADGSNDGYLALDTADDGSEIICVRQFTRLFENQIRCANLLNRDGSTDFPVSVTAPRFYADDWFRCQGNCGIYWEKYGGGWYMTDNYWIRSFGGKSIYTSGEIRCDAGFAGNLRGTADNANTVGDKSLQWILEQIKNSIVKIAILTGTVAHGGTIPLPNGFLESQCKWTVSPATIVDFATGGDLKGFGCTVDEHRKVSCVAESHGDSVNTIANYIIIGVK